MHKESLKSASRQAAQFWDSRTEECRAFLARCGWEEAVKSAVGSDSAQRRYFRLRRADGATAILMESIPDGNSLSTPGHRQSDFMRIGAWLRETGLNVPGVYESDTKEGFLLIEDFGDISFKTALAQGENPGGIYHLAGEVLAHLRKSARTAAALNLPDYYQSHVHKARRRVIDWYMPVVLGCRNEDGLAEEYLSVWERIEKTLPACPQGFLHIDYHVDNLMWLPAREGLMRCGILDFQGAMTGPQPYDLANLLEDARIDVAPGVRETTLDFYCRDMTAAERESFRLWYRVLATQFHCRVIGQFIRLALHDGKSGYLQFLPRLARYLEAGLADPLLAPLRSWFALHRLDFAKVPTAAEVSLAGVHIRPDAV